jgi:hypothetical protein
LIGPIWKDGVQVTNVWVGDAGDSEAGIHSEDLMRALQLMITASVIVVVSGIVFLSRSPNGG